MMLEIKGLKVSNHHCKGSLNCNTIKGMFLSNVFPGGPNPLDQLDYLRSWKISNK